MPTSKPTEIESYCTKYQRVDIVFDVYRNSSLKSETRSKRGSATRRRVTPSSKAPTNWMSFLRDNTNKTELFHFLAGKVCNTSTTSTTIIVTKGEDALSNQEDSLEELSPCTHEEADTHMFLHVRHATTKGSKGVVKKANDTDVVIIAISVFPKMKELGLQELWIDFGQGASARLIAVHGIVSTIGPEKARGLPFFHAFSGCDVVSAFRGKAKKSAWQTWSVCDQVSSTFTKLSQYPPVVEPDDLKKLERFVVMLYDRSSVTTSVNDARMELFARKQKPYDAIPPTSDALKEHVKRAAYQAGIIWSQATVPLPAIGSPADWGWVLKGETWHVSWTTLPPIAKSCQELTKCGCKNSCSNRRCKCSRSGLVCTALCSCKCQC